MRLLVALAPLVVAPLVVLACKSAADPVTPAPGTSAAAATAAASAAPPPLSPEEELAQKAQRAKQKRKQCLALVRVLGEHQERERIVNAADPKTLVAFAEELERTVQELDAAGVTDPDVAPGREAYGHLLTRIAASSREAASAKTTTEAQKTVDAIRSDTAKESSLIAGIQAACNKPLPD